MSCVLIFSSCSETLCKCDHKNRYTSSNIGNEIQTNAEGRKYSSASQNAIKNNQIQTKRPVIFQTPADSMTEKTFFIDTDGTDFKKNPSSEENTLNRSSKLLPKNE